MTAPGPVEDETIPVTEATAPFGRTLVVSVVAGLVIVGQLYAAIPLVPQLAASFGGTPSSMTWATTLFGFGYAGGFLIAGPVSDNVGRRRTIFAGLLVMAAASLAVAMAPSLAIGGAFRFVEGLGAAAFTPSALAYLGQRIEPDRRLLAITTLITAFSVAAVTGQLTAEGLAALVGWRGVFAVSAAAIALCAVALRMVLLPELTRGHARFADSFRTMGKLAARPPLTALYAAGLPVLGSFVAVYTALEILGSRDLASHITVLRLSVLPAMLAIPLANPVLKRIAALPRAAAGLAVSAAATLLLTLTSGSVLAAGAVLLVFVAANTLVSPATTATIGALCGQAQGSGLALYTFMLSMGASFGPQLVALLKPYGFAAAMIAVALFEFAGALCTLWAVPRLAAGRRPAG